MDLKIIGPCQVQIGTEVLMIGAAFEHFPQLVSVISKAYLRWCEQRDSELAEWRANLERQTAAKINAAEDRAVLAEKKSLELDGAMLKCEQGAIDEIAAVRKEAKEALDALAERARAQIAERDTRIEELSGQLTFHAKRADLATQLATMGDSQDARDRLAEHELLGEIAKTQEKLRLVQERLKRPQNETTGSAEGTGENP